MPIELNSILRNIADEKVLKPSNSKDAKKEDIEAAWLRVSKKIDLSVHETKSIFKVLQKKYEQERVKETSSWKLFEVMTEIHTPEDEEDDSEISTEENEEYEMLEVDEEQQQDYQHDDFDESESVKTETSLSQATTLSLKKTSSEMTSDGESPTKSSHENSPERAVEKQTDEKKTTKPSSAAQAPREEKKLLNSLLSPNNNSITQQRQPSKQMTPSAAALTLQQKRGITLKKTNTQSASSLLKSQQVSDSGKTIPLPESIKRKLNEDTTVTPQTKKLLLGQPSGNIQKISPNSNKSQPQQQQQQQAAKLLTQSKITAQGSILKKKDVDEKVDKSPNDEIKNAHSPTALTATMTQKSSESTNGNATAPTVTTHRGGLRVITFPAETKNEVNVDNSNTSGLNIITLPFEENGSLLQNGDTKTLVTAANGMPPPPSSSSSLQTEELDFSDHVLISSNAITTAGNNDDAVNNSKNPKRNCHDKESLINLGNFSEELPRAFFNNLCSSKRYEAFSLYIANVMNRLDEPIAARLELKIMRDVLDAQHEAMKES